MMISIIYEIGNSQFTNRFKHHGADSTALWAVLCIAALIFLCGCAGANYGSLKHSRDITQAFETYHVWPEHRYYYLNQENNPYAVVALGPGYTISDNRWIEFDPQTDKLEKEVDLVRKFPVNYSYAYGAYLKDATGHQIGYWYSSLPIRSLKVDGETKKVSIYTASPWLQDDDWGFGTGVSIGIGTGGSGIGVQIGR